MKRTKSFLLTVLMGVFLCLCFAFTGCSGKMEGTYKFKSMSYNQGGVSVELKVGEKFMGAITLSEDFMTVTLNEDGTVSMAINTGETGSETTTGTWTKKDDGKIEITVDGEAQSCTCDGKTLVIEVDGSSVTLAK